MALVLRKAVLPKNVSLLKCIKSRNLATTANKKNPAVLTAARLRRCLKEKSVPLGLLWKIEKAKKLQTSRRRCKQNRTGLRCCVSCPEFIPASRARILPRFRHHSPPPRVCLGFESSRAFSTLQKSCPETKPAPKECPKACGPLKTTPAQPKPAAKTPDQSSKRSYSCPCPCKCPCPFPCGPYGCGGCGCLPPPCNVPPRCIQYMTGYYYYPYGFWFCGPYHVSGLCCPVKGSCPCPCGPCPCGPCPKCCAPCCICPAPPPSGSSKPDSGLTSATFCPATVINPGTGSMPPMPRAMPCHAQVMAQGKATVTNTARSQLSKFFPFSASVAPNTGPTSATNIPSQLNTTPTDAGMMSSRNYSTPAELNAAKTPSRKYSTPAELNEATFFDPNYPGGNSPAKKEAGAASGISFGTPMSPRPVQTAEQRDRPRVPTGAFDYASVPKFKNPYPKPYEIKINPKKKD